MSRRRRTRRPPVGAFVVATVTVAFVALPLIGLFERVEWGSIVDDITSDETRRALRLSLICSVAATALALVLGTPLAWVLARTALPGRSVVRALVLLPMVLPPVVGGVALLGAFSRRSPIGGWLHEVLGIQLTFSTAGAVLAGTFVALPFFVLTVEGALRGLDVRYEDAAAGLGASRWTTFRRVTLPMIGPSVAAGAVLSWARALGEFGATITFAGNVEGRTRTLPLLVYLQLESDPDAAYALSAVLLAVCLLLLVGLRDRWLVRP